MKTYPSTKQCQRAHQRGVTLLGLLFWSIVVGSIALVMIRTVPALNEYRTLLGMVNRLAKEGGNSPQEIRVAFDRFKTIEYGIESVTSRDLDISKENDTIVVGFAYDKQIPLAGPVYLLIKFKGQSR
jgi:Domain of unknown function (DUF4845)